jgi:hypothetical protein
VHLFVSQFNNLGQAEFKPAAHLPTFTNGQTVKHQSVYDLQMWNLMNSLLVSFIKVRVEFQILNNEYERFQANIGEYPIWRFLSSNPLTRFSITSLISWRSRTAREPCGWHVPDLSEHSVLEFSCNRKYLQPRYFLALDFITTTGSWVVIDPSSTWCFPKKNRKADHWRSGTRVERSASLSANLATRWY